MPTKIRPPLSLYGLPDPPPLPPDVEEAVESHDLLRVREAALAAGLDPAACGFRSMNRLGYGLDWPLAMDTAMRKQIEMINAVAGVSVLIKDYGGSRTLDDPMGGIYLGAPGPIHDRDAPSALLLLVRAETLSAEGLHEGVRWAWKHCEFPEANLPVTSWREIFAESGGVICDHLEYDPAIPHEPVCTREGEALTLYRGAIPSRRKGMAWSADRERAQWFADRFSSAGMLTAHVYSAQVEPSRVLARFVGRGEDEYVIDTRMMHVVRA